MTKLVFKQSRGADFFYSNLGYTIKRISPKEASIVDERWGLFDPSGVLLEDARNCLNHRHSHALEGFDVELYNAYKRYGSCFNKPFTISPAHLTPGTKFRVSSSVKPNEENTPLTVKHILDGRGGHFCVETVEVRGPDSRFFSGEPHTYDINHVEEIIERVPGAPKYMRYGSQNESDEDKSFRQRFGYSKYFTLESSLSDVDFNDPEEASFVAKIRAAAKPRRGEVVLNLWYMESLIEEIMETELSADACAGRGVDMRKLFKRLRSANMIRSVRVRRDAGECAYDGIYMVELGFLKLKEVKKLLKKNPSWALETMRTAIKRREYEDSHPY